MRKKGIAVLLVGILAVCMFAGCNAPSADETDRNGQEELKKEIQAEAEIVAGKFYTLKEAYENGDVTKEDLRDIAYYYHAEQGLVYDETYSPRPKTPSDLDEGTIRSIKTAYAYDFIKNQLKISGADPAGVRIETYYGTYHGCAAVYMRSEFIFADLIVVPEYEFGGVVFHAWADQVLLWKPEAEL